MKKAVPCIVGIGELQRQASWVIKKVGAEGGEGFIVSHNEPQAVLLSLERYERLTALERARGLEEEDVLTVVAQGDREYEAGSTRKARSLKEFL